MRFLIVFSSLLVLTAAIPQDFALRYYQPQTGIANSIDSSKGGEKYLPPVTTTQGPLLQKQFYSFSASNDDQNTQKTKHLVLGRSQKNYRVIFIKAPASENANVKYSFKIAPQEEKTVIYVLSKKDKELSASDISTPGPTQPPKPEVFFIKYETSQEAEAAQKEIQNQYKFLGGTDDQTEEEKVRVTSVVGAFDSQSPQKGYDYKRYQRI